MMRDADIGEIAKGVFDSKHKSLKSLEVRSEDDFDGASIIRVTAFVAEASGGAAERLDMVMALRNELERKGENRFVYLDLKSSRSSDDVDEEEEMLRGRTRQ